MSEVLDYIRSKDVRFKAVPDAELTEYVGTKFPEFLKDQDFNDDFYRVTHPAEAAALSATEQDRGIPSDSETARLNPRSLEPAGISAWQRFRTSDWGHRLFGPTDLEKEAEIRGPIGLTEIPKKMLEFTSLPPPGRKAVSTVLESPVGKVIQPIRLIGPKAEAVMRGATELVTESPIAPLGGGVAGKVAMGAFTGEFISNLENAREEYRTALENGDAPKAIEIATQTMLGGALVGLGTAHAMGAFEAKPTTPTEVVAPRTAEAVTHSEQVLTPETPAPAPVPEAEATMAPVEARPIEPPSRNLADRELANQIMEQRQPANLNQLFDIAQDFVERIAQLKSTTEAQRTRSKLIRTMLDRPTEATGENLASLLGLRYDPLATEMPSKYQFVQGQAPRFKEPLVSGSAEHEAMKPELEANERRAYDRILQEVQQKGGEPNAIYGTTGEVLPTLQTSSRTGEAQVPTAKGSVENVTPPGGTQGEARQPSSGGTEALRGGVEREAQGQKVQEENVLTQPAAVVKPSAADVGIVPSGIQLSMDTIGNPAWWRRYFTSSRGLPEGVPAAWLQREGEVRSQTREATYAARDLANALREEYQIGTGKFIVKGLRDVPKPTMQAIQNVLTGRQDISSLPERLREPVQKIRDHVDNLSHEIRDTLVDSESDKIAKRFEGVSPDSIRSVLNGEAPIDSLPENVRPSVSSALEKSILASIDENLGIYLNRSYRIFDDPKWVRKIPVEIRQQAESFLSNQLADQRAKSAAMTGLGWDVLTEKRSQSQQWRTAFDNARAQVDPASFRGEAQTKLREMLADWSDSGIDKLMRQGNLGTKDLSLFMARKDIAPEIRAVMGEYKDPVTNYVRSVTKMARFLGDQEFLNQIKALGMDKWLFEEGKTPPGYEHVLSAEGSSAMSPLNGLRTSEEIKQVFEAFNRNRTSDHFLAKLYYSLNSWSKEAKTVYSALTQARNIIGNPAFNIKSGHFNFGSYGKAFLTQIADIAGSNKAAQEFYKEMTKYGLVDENPVVGELRDAIRDAGLTDPNFEDYTASGWRRVWRLAHESPQRAYRLPDEMGKTVGWLAEQSDLAAAHPDWTPEQVKQEAATRVRNEYPTYSMVPEALKQFRKQPFFGPFVNFAYETIRNGYWALRNGSTDLFTGENARQRANGAKKLAGFATVLASGTGLSKLSQYLFNVQKGTDDDIRRFLPDYAKNHQMLIYGKDGTKLRYVDWSYLNPYSQMTDPFVAAMNNDEPGMLNGAAAALGEIIKPFTNEQMLAGAIKEIHENRDANGNRIYNPQDPDKIDKILGRMVKAIEPGSLERFKSRIWPAATGKPWPSGDERNLGLEVFSEFSGLRLEQKDLTKQLSFKVREFEDNLKDARQLATKVLLSSDVPTAEDGLAAYVKADNARFKLWRELYRDTGAILRQGATVSEVRKILDSSGISAVDRNKLMRGDYVPLEITPETFRDLKKPVPRETLSAINAERRERAQRKLE